MMNKFQEGGAKKTGYTEIRAKSERTGGSHQPGSLE